MGFWGFGVLGFFGIIVILADIRGQFGTPSGLLNFYRHFFQNFSGEMRGKCGGKCGGNAGENAGGNAGENAEEISDGTLPTEFRIDLCQRRHYS